MKIRSKVSSENTKRPGAPGRPGWIFNGISLPRRGGGLVRWLVLGVIGMRVGALCCSRNGFFVSGVCGIWTSQRTEANWVTSCSLLAHGASLALSVPRPHFGQVQPIPGCGRLGAFTELYAPADRRNVSSFGIIIEELSTGGGVR